MSKELVFMVLAASIFFNVIPALANEYLCAGYFGTWNGTDCNIDDPEEKAAYETAYQAWKAQKEKLDNTDRPGCVLPGACNFIR